MSQRLLPLLIAFIAINACSGDEPPPDTYPPVGLAPAAEQPPSTPESRQPTIRESEVAALEARAARERELVALASVTPDTDLSSLVEIYDELRRLDPNNTHYTKMWADTKIALEEGPEAIDDPITFDDQATADPLPTQNRPKQFRTLTRTDTTKLALLRLNWRLDSVNNVWGEGEVRNLSSEPLGLVKILVSFYDDQNAFLFSDYTYLDIRPLLPQHRSPFSLAMSHREGMKAGKIDFLMSDAQIEWVDYRR